MSQQLKTGTRITYPRKSTPLSGELKGQTHLVSTTGTVIWLGTRMFQVQTDCGRLPYLDYNDDWEILDEQAEAD